MHILDVHYKIMKFNYWYSYQNTNTYLNKDIILRPGLRNNS